MTDHCAVMPTGHNWVPAWSTAVAPSGHEWQMCGACGRSRTVPIRHRNVMTLERAKREAESRPELLEEELRLLLHLMVASHSDEWELADDARAEKERLLAEIAP